MKSFEKYIDAENYAKEVSARELKPINIVHLFDSKPSNRKKEFTVIDIKDEWFYGIQLVMCIKNYDTPFEVHSYSPKSGQHVEAFPTRELADIRAIELKRERYRRDVWQRDLTPEQYQDIWVKPYSRCNAFVEEHRQELLAL